MSEKKQAERIPIREGLFAGKLADLDSLTLLGCACRDCEEVALGERELCANCGSSAVDSIPLSRRGMLWTYTVSRHRPPGDYRGAEPFEPYGLGLIELPEGIRVMSPLHGDIDELEIGAAAEFAPYVRREADGEVVAFSFAIDRKDRSNV